MVGMCVTAQALRVGYLVDAMFGLRHGRAVCYGRANKSLMPKGADMPSDKAFISDGAEVNSRVVEYLRANVLFYEPVEMLCSVTKVKFDR